MQYTGFRIYGQLWDQAKIDHKTENTLYPKNLYPESSVHRVGVEESRISGKFCIFVESPMQKLIVDGSDMAADMKVSQTERESVECLGCLSRWSRQ